MLRITIPQKELYDDVKEQFVYIKQQDIKLENSLVSISKWEAKWEKPFLNTKRTTEETIDYIRCMCITQNVDDMIFQYGLTEDNIKDIEHYINRSMTATWFGNEKNKKKSLDSFVGRPITSELIYYWMIASGVPFECQKWNINRLITLIRVCQEESNPKKMSRQEILERNRMINEQRKKQYNTRG